MADPHPGRVMPARAHGRSLMGVQALPARPHARSHPRGSRWLPIAGDAALALALAAPAVVAAATAAHVPNRPDAITLALLQTQPPPTGPASPPKTSASGWS